MNLTLNIYDDKGIEVVKTLNAGAYDLMFGTVVQLMDLLNIENIDDKMQMLKTIYSAWNEIKVVLSGVFPEATEEDWKHVKVKELLPVIIDIAKFSVTEMLDIPVDEKN